MSQWAVRPKGSEKTKMHNQTQISFSENVNSGKYKKISEAEIVNLREEKIRADQCWSDYYDICIGQESHNTDSKVC